MVDEFVLHCVRADAPPTTQCKFSAVTLGGPASKVERVGILCCLDPRAHFCRGRLLPLIVLATDTKVSMRLSSNRFASARLVLSGRQYESRMCKAQCKTRSNEFYRFSRESSRRNANLCLLRS
jgi:hypothetical protein